MSGSTVIKVYKSVLFGKFGVVSDISSAAEQLDMGSSQRQLVLPILLLLALAGTALCGVQEVHNVLELTGQAANKLKFSTDVATEKYTPPEEMDPQYWYNIADEEITKRLQLPQPNSQKAKNIIMFLGDGMPLSTVAAARILKGQRQGNTGEESSLSFERFPYTGLSRVSCG